MALDLDRGVLIKFHPHNRMQVATYIDTPGEYYSEVGSPIAAELARQAGFDVEKDLRKKAMNARISEFKRKQEAEARQEEDAFAQALSSDTFDVRHIGGGQYALYDKKGKDGRQLTKVAMTKADIELLVGKVQTDPNDPGAGEPPVAS